eukprot:1774350-Prymnesium_polylepis.4
MIQQKRPRALVVESKTNLHTEHSNHCIHNTAGPQDPAVPFPSVPSHCKTAFSADERESALPLDPIRSGVRLTGAGQSSRP